MIIESKEKKRADDRSSCRTASAASERQYNDMEKHESIKKRLSARSIALVLALVFLFSGFAALAVPDIPHNRHELSAGVQNIVKRAYQMTDITWTPQQDITAWDGDLVYRAGVTYSGLPYGQPVYAKYVPWSADLNTFASAVQDTSSKMYTARSTYNCDAPYYSTDCSAFVSWAWELSSRQTTRTIPNVSTKISDNSYADAQVGDCLCYPGVHTALITDITYDDEGTINGIELSESSANSAKNDCCSRTWFGAGYSRSLETLQTTYLDSGYALYRNPNRESVTYSHSCASPLEGDVCALCGAGSSGSGASGGVTGVGIDVSKHQGSIDWDQAAGQIDFAILRCGLGDDFDYQDDPYFVRNAEACERLGIPYGVYLYSYADSDEHADSEISHVLRLLNGRSPTLPVYLDLEDTTVASLDNETILRHAREFCTAVANAGFRPGVYANYNWWTTRLTSAEYDQWSRWIARYGPSDPGYSGPYDFWQYTDSGSVSGISGNVDMNYSYCSLSPEPIPHEHVYSADVVFPATCEAAGTMRYVCSECGDSYEEAIPALGHVWSTTTVEPACTESGSTIRVCGRCGKREVLAEIPPLGHSFEQGVCTRCGELDTETPKGDLNFDGYVTSADAVMLLRHLVGYIELTQQQRIAADLDNDGSVTSADSVKLARMLVND